jgi:hypothetical protein
MMIKNLLQINLATHRVHVAKDEETGEFILFKCDDSACDFIVTPDGNIASDWVHEPLPTTFYRVTIEDEPECE